MRVTAPSGLETKPSLRWSLYVGHGRVAACPTSGHAVERGDPGRVGPSERLAASPRTVALMFPLVSESNVRAVLPTVRVPTLVVQHADDPFITPAMGRDVADHIPDAKYVELPGRNLFHFVEPWRASLREIVEFLTGDQAEVADDRVLATVLFTDIVDSTRRAAEIGECEVPGDDIGGIAVHIGARVSALAGPNDVLVSSTLRDLVIGSGLEFEERGAHELKGVPGEWRLFAVASP
jgi:hypothetical protein